MKKILCIMISLLLLAGCSSYEEYDKVYENETLQSYITGVWLSYSELDSLLASGNFKSEFESALSNCKARGITDMFIHIRPFCDSLYPSKYFPLRQSTQGYDFDVLEFIINVCHENGIKIHGWINPYRVSTGNSDISSIPKNSPVHTLPQSAICIYNGVYLNPSSFEVRQLIINGIREIVNGYDIDGIHFDDYFYPTQDEAFDSAVYNSYCEETVTPLSLADWRRTHVNALISGCYTAIKFSDKDVVFSVSPSASIADNYNENYADTVLWCESGCVDYIIPQLYFGFEYPDDNFKFENLVTMWRERISGTTVRLLVGLAAYKINTEQEPDRIEWQQGSNIIKRQIEICRNTHDISGHIYFSYSAMCNYL